MHGAQSLSGREVQLAAYPDGELRASDFRIVEVPVREPGPGEVLVRNTWTSVDPGLRLRLAESAPAGYFAAFRLRSAMDGIMTVGEVIESRADGFCRGRHGVARVRVARLRRRRRPERRRSAGSAR